MTFPFLRLTPLLPFVLWCSWPGAACAQTVEPPADPPERPITFTGRYVIDLMGVAAGGEQRGRRVLGNAELTADADMDRLIGWHGGRVHVHALDNHGRGLNDLAGTVQGINNIEVSDGRIKLYEAWAEQSFAHGRAALLFGLSDLNADFYQNDAASLLIAPAFGIGSELSATGPNGPSIFPSTALTARLNVLIGKTGYVRVAAVNARAGVLGDVDGVDTSLRDGALLIAEAGTTRGGKLAFGLWRYTRRQDDLRMVDANGDPIRRIAQGAYVLLDQRLKGDDSRGVDVFLRAGVSDGKTTSFAGGVQIGLLGRGLIPHRPDAQVSIGLAHGVLSRGFRDAIRDAGETPAGAETGVELTYQDRLLPFLSVQPDVQYIHRPFAGGGRRDTLVVGLRLIASFERH